MAEIFENLISLDQLEWFRKDFERLIDLDPVLRPYNPDDAKRMYGVENCSVQDQRHILSSDDPAYQLMKKILAPILPNNVYFYMAYQRQFLPHQLHVDVGSETVSAYFKSAIIPLHENIDNIFKTIIWNQVFESTADMMAFFNNFVKDSSQYPIISDVSATQDVDHCWGKPSIVDVMPVECVYPYQLGSMVLFDRTHIHCSSNWRKYNVCDHKDIILLHIG